MDKGGNVSDLVLLTFSSRETLQRGSPKVMQVRMKKPIPGQLKFHSDFRFISNKQGVNQSFPYEQYKTTILDNCSILNFHNDPMK